MTRKLNIEVITGRPRLDEVVQDWTALASENPRDGFFLTPTWYLAWLDHLSLGARPFVCIVRDEAGRIVGVAPLCQMRYADFGLRLEAVGFGGREIASGDYLNFLTIAAPRERVIASILETLWGNRFRWGLLVLGELLAEGDLLASTRAWAGRHGLAVRIQEERRCPFIVLPESYEKYLAGLRYKLRYEVKRDARDLLEKQGARIDVCSDPARAGQELEELIHLHVARWQRAGLPGTLGQPGFAGFLTQVCQTLPPSAGYRLFVLRKGAQAVAALLSFYFGETAFYYQVGWDPNSPLTRYSPGVVLIGKAIEDAIRSGLRYFDFLRGDEAYKFRWTKDYRTTVTLLLARSPVARGYLHAAQTKDWVKTLLGRPPVGDLTQLRKSRRAELPAAGTDSSPY